ncbi:MAG: helix-hairpin-helix domain-containing protein [Deltaproteobacteria bacterium]|nr:helix-hairpin-helix domain-containing protein [Deltaproteobacteria bacterium]
MTSSRLRAGALLSALLALGLGALGLYRVTRPAPEAAGPALPACEDPVAVAWPGDGERLGCLSELAALYALAAHEAGCEPGETLARIRLGVGERLRVSSGEGGACAAEVEMLPGSSLLTLGLPIDLNRATVSDLEALAAIGPTRARAIVAHREAHGPFATVEALEEVSGIGEATLAAVAGQLVVAPQPGPGGR